MSSRSHAKSFEVLSDTLHYVLEDGEADTDISQVEDVEDFIRQ